MRIKQYPTQESLRALYTYDGKTVYVISELPCVGGLERKSGRTRRDHCFIGVKSNRLSYISAYVPGNNGLFQLHRLVWIYHNGTDPEGMYVDHINHVPYDNRIENLRLSTPAENQQNRINKRKGSKGNVIGVIPSGTGFNAFVSRNGKPVYLGYFSEEQDAIDARTKAARELYGEFCNL
jgi:hypothetical protein